MSYTTTREELAEELAEIGGSLSPTKKTIARACLTLEDRITFYDELATYMDRRERIPHALYTLWDLYTHGGTSNWVLTPVTNPIAVLLPDWLHRVMHLGEDWSTIMADWLPRREAMLMASLFSAGAITNGAALRSLAANTLKLGKAKVSVAAAQRTSYLVILVFVAGMYWLSVDFLPQFMADMPGKSLRGEAATLQRVSDLSTVVGPILLALILTIPFGLRFLYPRLTGGVRLFCERWLGWLGFTTYKEWSGVDFISAMATHLAADRTIDDARDRIAQTAEPYVAERLAAAALHDDKTLAEQFMAAGHEWPDERTLRTMHIFLSGPDPEKALLVLSERTADKLIAQLHKRAERTKTITTIIAGIVLGWLTFAYIAMTASVTH